MNSSTSAAPHAHPLGLRLYVFGRLRIEQAGEPVRLPRRKVKALLAYLALHPEPHPRDRLAGLFWGEFADAQARASLRNALAVLRKALGNQVLNTEQDAVQLHPDYPRWVDALEFAQLIHSAATANPETLVQALRLYRGELMPGFYDEWAVLAREYWLAQFERAMHQLLQVLVTAQRWHEVLEWAEDWVAQGRVPEPAYVALMLAHAGLGDRAKVATVFQRCTEALRDELGVDPAAETVALYQQLTQPGRLPEAPFALMPRAVSSALPNHQPPEPGEPPYKGLHFFTDQDADLFFGRERLIASLVGLVQQAHAPVVLVGASGSGKSSLIRAGLIPALRQARGGAESASARSWSFHIISPTAQPGVALARVLAPAASGEATPAPGSDPGHSLLVVDQFEELFTLGASELERRRFIGDLAAWAQWEEARTTVVISLRADFYAQCGQYAPLRDALATRQVYMGPMSAEELRRAIEAPAQRGGWVFEPGLVDLILRDAGSEPGALPLLAHALRETWQRRRGRRLTLQGYAEAGGVRGAIAKTAESVYQRRLSPPQQRLARRIFLRLTEPGESNADTRRRATFAELIPQADLGPDVAAVVHLLAGARLLTLAENHVEVAHEALIREWPRLREWLAQDREGLRLHRHLARAAQEWDELERDPGALYRGARLDQAREWSVINRAELSALEGEFLEASQVARAREEADREAQREAELAAARKLAETERQAADRLRRYALYLASALLVALLATGTALFFGRQARRNALAAEHEGRLSLARELASASVSNLEVDPERSLLLALEAVSTTYARDGTWTLEAEAALHRALEASRVRLTLHGYAGSATSPIFSPDGRRLATLAADGTVWVWDSASGARLLSFAAQTGANLVGSGLAFSPDGKRLATASADGRPKIWDAATGAQLMSIPAHSGPAVSVGFSPDGARLVTASTDTTAKIWDAATGRLLLTLTGHHDVVVTAEFSADSQRVVTASFDQTAIIWDAQTGERLQTLGPGGHTDAIRAAAFSPDGTRVATASQDATARIWDAASGQPLLALYGHASFVTSVHYSSDGTRLITASEDGSTRLWDAVTGQALLTLSGHASGVLGAAFSPDGQWAATASRDQTARIWDVSPAGGREWLNLAGHNDLVLDVAYSPDGLRLATGSWDHTAIIWDATTGARLRTLAGHAGPVQALTFHPDGRRLATVSDDGTARVWDTDTGRVERVLPTAAQPAGFSAQGVAFSPDGRWLATTGPTMSALVWNADNGEQQLVLDGHAGPVLRLAFNPDGHWLATASADGTARTWDAQTGAALVTVAGHTGQVNGVAFSPDGQWLATAGNDGQVRVWEASTGAALGTLAGHQGAVFGVAFSPDGRKLATTSVDRTVRVWTLSPTLEPSQESLTLFGHNRAIFRAVFSPDGTHLATASRDTTARVYIMPIDELVAAAQARLTRTWTLDECRRFLHREQCPP